MLEISNMISKISPSSSSTTSRSEYQHMTAEFILLAPWMSVANFMAIIQYFLKEFHYHPKCQHGGATGSVFEVTKVSGIHHQRTMNMAMHRIVFEIFPSETNCLSHRLSNVTRWLINGELELEVKGFCFLTSTYPTTLCEVYGVAGLSVFRKNSCYSRSISLDSIKISISQCCLEVRWQTRGKQRRRNSSQWHMNAAAN